MKSPEEYFLNQELWSPEGEFEEVTDAEKGFFKKFLGIDAEVQSLPVLEEEIEPMQDQILIGSEIIKAGADVARNVKESLVSLREQEEIQFVSFKVSNQEFVLPVECIQEVVNYIKPAKLPSVPDSIAGIANLRGRVTPLVRLDKLMERENFDTDFKFIIVCRLDGLQVGLIINSIATMYRISQDQIDWGLSSGDDLVSGVVKLGDVLIGIITIDRIVNRIIN